MSQKIEKREGFSVTEGRGFHITFANGWSVSVQFGPGNYCEHYEKLSQCPDYKKYNEWVREFGEAGSGTAEIAVIAPGSGLIDLTEFDPEWSDSVAGYVTPAKVVELMVWTMLKDRHGD